MLRGLAGSGIFYNAAWKHIADKCTFHLQIYRVFLFLYNGQILLLDFALNRTDQKNWKNIFSCSKSIKKGIWNGIPIYGIPHPSSRVSGDDWGAIALYLRSELENQ